MFLYFPGFTVSHAMKILKASNHVSWQLDEWEQDLKSLKNYKDSLDRVLEKYPDVRKYLEKNLLPFPADWPGWYYPKKLLANNCS